MGKWKSVRSLVLVFLALVAGCGKIETKSPAVATSDGILQTDQGPLRYQIINGQAVSGGDIRLGSADSIQTLAARQQSAGVSRAAVINNFLTQRWPGGRVPYVISSEAAPYRDTIQAAISALASQTYARFVPRNGESDYVEFIQSDDPGACYSYLGRTGGRQPIGVQGACPAGAVLHEMGHALGFIHEHQRPDRDGPITFYAQNADSSRISQLAANPPGTAVTLSPYDVTSIMHYDSYAFSQNRLPTMCDNTGTFPKTRLSNGVLCGLIPYHVQPVLSAADITAINAMARSSIVVSGNPCVLDSSGICTVNVTWTSGSPGACVFVSTPGAASKLVSCGGSSGSFSAPWITAASDTFLLYAGTNAYGSPVGPVLDNVTVVGTSVPADTTRAHVLVASQNPCVLQADGTCGTIVTWKTTATKACLFVQSPSGTYRWLDCGGPTGRYSFTGMTPAGAVFSLYTDGGPGGPLGSLLTTLAVAGTDYANEAQSPHSLFASQNPCALNAAGTCLSNIFWKTSLPSACVFVKSPGIASHLFSCGGSTGMAQAGFITAQGATFELYAGVNGTAPSGSVLASVQVVGAASTSGKGANVVAASQNPCLLSVKGTCSTQISWNSTQASSCVFVRTPNASPRLFSCNQNGAVEADWITASGATFELYASAKGTAPVGPVLASLSVNGTNDPDLLSPVDEIVPAQGSCILSSAGTCSIDLTWKTAQPTSCIFVSDASTPLHLFTCAGTTGAATAPWITRGSVNFYLYSGASNGQPVGDALAVVSVAGIYTGR